MKNFNASSTEAASKEARIERFNTNCEIIVTEFPNLQKLFTTFLEIEYSQANIDWIKVQLYKFMIQSNRFLVSAQEVLTVNDEMQNAGEYTEEINEIVNVVRFLTCMIVGLCDLASEFLEQPKEESITALKVMVKEFDDLRKTA